MDLISDAYLELETPSIPQGVDNFVKQGATEIIIALNFLNSGKHVDQDIPAIINACRRQYPHVSIRIAPPLSKHPAISQIFLDLIKHAKT